MAFRSAMYLEKEYLDVLKTKEPYILLHNAINEVCLNRLLVMNDIMTSMQMTSQEIADFMAEQISRSIIKSRFYLLQNPFSNSFGQNTLWGYDLDREFHLFLELCPTTVQLGTCLLKYCDALKTYRKWDTNQSSEPEIPPTQNAEEMREIFNHLRSIMENQVLSHKKQNTISVELLIKAHDCFVHECSMEGIANVLQRCKIMNATLATAKSWHLIVKLLMGVGRYRDMYYCFETLKKNDQFESLLGRFDEERTNGLKEAIISYLHENYPEDKENYRLTALHFRMYKEQAQMYETNAKSIIAKILSEAETTKSDGNSTSISLASMAKSDGFDANSNVSDSIQIAANAANQSNLSVTFMRCYCQMMTTLSTVMEYYSTAADNYLLDNKLDLAQRTAYNAELVALQINLIRTGLSENRETCVCVLNIRSEAAFRWIINNELR